MICRHKASRYAKDDMAVKLDNGRQIISIVSIDKNWGIGNGGDLLAHLPTDMKFFKNTTMDNIIVMGRKTFESLPGAKPLPGRLNVIITRNQDYLAGEVARGEVVTTDSVESAIELLNKDAEDRRDLYVIGGGEIYKQFLPYVDACLVTKFDEEYTPDTFFPNLDEDENFTMTAESEPVTEKDITFVFTKYSRVKG